MCKESAKASPTLRRLIARFFLKSRFLRYNGLMYRKTAMLFLAASCLAGMSSFAGCKDSAMPDLKPV
ncbi:MAG: hypothetical protein NTU83_04700, partial [Candidatus Hydrogenedentes bacterium]|nr:hypothetical protein [Candidatus Hydrogenedentota bacterium]